MTLLQGGNDSVFKDPDMYLLSLHIYAPKCGPSPFIHLGSFVGSKDNGDTLPWTCILKPRQIHYFLKTTAFAATVMSGMTDIKVESVSSAGTRVEVDVAAHCDQLERKESEKQGLGWANALDLINTFVQMSLTAYPIKDWSSVAISIRTGYAATDNLSIGFPCGLGSLSLRE
ncbi:hypothetical protein B0H14DRAFT_2654015 [Mycena olivaceomarginata]|nr:hypothetical protein B0H14DRAFT_2654015 [Mycena olivaceomarginata]